VNVAGCGTRGARLLPGQSEIAQKHRLFGIAQVIDFDHAASAPLRIAGDKIGNAGVALPPAFVGIAQTAEDYREAMRLRRIGDVPDFVGGIAESAQQVDLAFVGVRQKAAIANAVHLRATELQLFRRPSFAGNVRKVDRVGRIGDVENRGAVVFNLASQRIRRRSAVVADVGDPTSSLLVNCRLIGAAALEIIGADEFHVAGFRLLLRP
jgi:hypothetical protein